ncbi:hypothetical protein CR513_08248, partial [Mucuna pruriens]
MPHNYGGIPIFHVLDFPSFPDDLDLNLIRDFNSYQALMRLMANPICSYLPPRRESDEYISIPFLASCEEEPQSNEEDKEIKDIEALQDHLTRGRFKRL